MSATAPVDSKAVAEQYFKQALELENTDLRQAIRFYLDAAELGHVLAQVKIARFYFENAGGTDPEVLENDPNAYKKLELMAIALKYLEQPIAQNNPEALYLAGEIHCQGGSPEEGTYYLPSDKKKAYEFTERAAKLNYPDALLEMAVLNTQVLQDNPYSRLDMGKAFEYFQLAAQYGNHEAEFWLAQFYSSEYPDFIVDGIPKDDAKAIQYFRLSANGGCWLAIQNFSYFLRGNCGFKTNELAASQTYKSALALKMSNNKQLAKRIALFDSVIAEVEKEKSGKKSDKSIVTGFKSLVAAAKDQKTDQGKAHVNSTKDSKIDQDDAPQDNSRYPSKKPPNK